MEIVRIKSVKELLGYEKEIKSFLKDDFEISFPSISSIEKIVENKFEDLKEYIDIGSAIVYIAKDERVIGWVWCHSIERTDERRIHIPYITVDKDFQNKGVGKKLLEHVERYAKNIGIEYIDLLVTRDNTNAVSFYENNMFETERLMMKKKIV